MLFYTHLLKQTEQSREALFRLPLIRAGMTGQVSREAYVGFLTQAYHHVKHTVPLLMLCGAKLPESYEWLRTALSEYIEEELGHQEWILDDIAAAGGDANAVRLGQPSVATELMVAYAYDMIQRRNPIGFFGMVLVLEGTSTALATQAAGVLQKSLNLPNQAFRYLSSHGALDIEHTSFYEQLMNQIETAEDQAMIIHSANVFYYLYGNIFNALGESFLSKPLQPSLGNVEVALGVAQ